MNNSSCYCGSTKLFSECCLPLIKGEKNAITALELMKSRYSAYNSVDVEYIVKTTHPLTRKMYTRNSIKAWAINSKWLKLEIISFSLGGLNDSKGIVEFKAYYFDEKNKAQIHHEISIFEKLDSVWYYLSAK